MTEVAPTWSLVSTPIEEGEAKVARNLAQIGAIVERLLKKLWGSGTKPNINMQDRYLFPLSEYIYEWWRGNLYTFHYSVAVQP